MNVRQEFEFARGMVERRKGVASNLSKAESAREAKENHRDILGAVREVNRHRHNVMEAIDDKTAKYAVEVDQLLFTVTQWREWSRVELGKWGVSDQEVRDMEYSILGGI